MLRFSLDGNVRNCIIKLRQSINPAIMVSAAHACLHNTYQNSGAHTRAKFATVPNIGGFAGASWRIQNFKVSAGYRADLFFGAMDGGIDAAKKENVGFYGPFASVSVGLGG